MLKVLADENISHSLVALLQRRKIDVLWVPSSRYKGSSDVILVGVANSQKRIILTMDRDFAAQYYLTKIKTGIIYLKLGTSKENLERIANSVETFVKRAKGKIVTLGEEYSYIEKL